ncbi:MAG: serine/threonine-protein kinase, partial [Planctomycetota bacterium]
MPVKVDDSVEVIFSAALEQGTEAERATFLKEVCGGDGELWGRVDALLDAHTSAGSFLERPVLGGATVDLAPPGEGPGTMIGPYKLIQLIGEGGFGSVHLAVQTWPV